MRDVSLYTAKQGKEYFVSDIRARGLNFYRGPSKLLDHLGIKRNVRVKKLDHNDSLEQSKVLIGDDCHYLSKYYTSKIFVRPDKEKDSKGLEGRL